MRSRGEGSVYHGRSGLVAQVTTGYVDGKRQRKTLYQHKARGESEREFRARVRKTVREVEQGMAVPTDERMLLSAYLDRWLQSVEPSLRPRTFRGYSDHIRLHIAPALGGIRLVKLTPDQVQRFLNEQDLSPMMVRHLRNTLRTALNQAVRWGLVNRNVATLVTPPRLERRELRVLTPDEAKALLRAAEGHEWEALFHVAFLGLRKGEILGLEWRGIDWQRSTVRVERSLQRINGSLVLTEPKTERSRRTVLAPQSIMEALREHKARQGFVKIDHGLVFCRESGEPIEPRAVTTAFHRLTRKAGLPRIRFHDLRHSTATLLLAQGVPVTVVAEVLGHTDTQMVSKVYGHVIEQMRSDAADKMERILGH